MSSRGRWKGSVVVHGGWLALRLKDATGKWADRGIGLRDTPSNRALAEQELAAAVEEWYARKPTGHLPGPETMRAWAKEWFRQREEQKLTRVSEDEQKFKRHWLAFRPLAGGPDVGEMLLRQVQPTHIWAALSLMEKEGYAPRTRHNLYFLIKALFRDAEILGKIPRGSSPCILTKRQLGKKRDGKSGWRRKASFSREELAVLISDPRIPIDRRIWNALCGIGMLRTGEAAGLRFDAIDSQKKPLGLMDIFTSYDDGTTKTDEERWTPIHPTLAAMLAEWRLTHWPAIFGRTPTPKDLVCPVVPKETKRGRPGKSVGTMRDRHYSWKRATKDLVMLGLRHRRVHDLRRTGISLARSDGAVWEVLRWGTHAPPKSVDGLYTDFEWRALCAEVLKLNIKRCATTDAPESGSPLADEAERDRATEGS